MKTSRCFGFVFTVVLASATYANVAVAQITPLLQLGLTNGKPEVVVMATPGTILLECTESLGVGSVWRLLNYTMATNQPWVWVDSTPLASDMAGRYYRVASSTTLPPTNPNPSRLIWIPPGVFTMGSPSNEVNRRYDEGPQTVVTLTYGFFIDKFLVTQGDYLAVVGSNPSVFTGDTNRPVDSVNWVNATNYCTALTHRERIAGRLPVGWAYRLPREAEWEYACRAGTTTPFTFGDDYFDLTNYAWFSWNSGTTQPVGTKLPNPWGLYDVHGNVIEICYDWYSYSLPGGSVTNPVGPASGTVKVMRGGCAHADWPPKEDRSACRHLGGFPPLYTWCWAGFRVVLAPTTPGG
jgi:formylglycine-generating enzyme required for sulfatase activity